MICTRISILFLLSFSAGFCNRKCSSYQQRPLTGKIDLYFGVYKPGNWWVYENKGGTESDSIYTINFSDKFTEVRTVCERQEAREFVLVGKYLTGGDSVFVKYRAASIGIQVDFNFSPGYHSAAPFPYFIYNIQLDTISSFAEVPAKNLLDSISLNGSKYSDILVGKGNDNTYFFSPNKGLVGWGTPNDTFFLVKSKIL